MAENEIYSRKLGIPTDREVLDWWHNFMGMNDDNHDWTDPWELSHLKAFYMRLHLPRTENLEIIVRRDTN